MPDQPESDPDAALMLRVREGDAIAFEALVEKYKQPVINLVFRILQDVTEAEDIAQHVFVQVHKNAARYEVTAKFSTWLFTIARNLCLNEIRRRQRHPAQSIDEPLGDSAETGGRQLEDTRSFGPPDLLVQKELTQKIDAAMAELPEHQRTAIQLCRDGDLSYEEIGAVLGCSLAATKSLIHRARETLKLRLRPYLRTGAWSRDGDKMKLCGGCGLSKETVVS